MNHVRDVPRQVTLDAVFIYFYARWIPRCGLLNHVQGGHGSGVSNHANRLLEGSHALQFTVRIAIASQKAAVIACNIFSDRLQGHPWTGYPYVLLEPGRPLGFLSALR
jgi:hypothetical protein